MRREGTPNGGELLQSDGWGERRREAREDVRSWSIDVESDGHRERQWDGVRRGGYVRVKCVQEVVLSSNAVWRCEWCFAYERLGELEGEKECGRARGGVNEVCMETCACSRICICRIDQAHGGQFGRWIRKVGCKDRTSFLGT